MCGLISVALINAPIASSNFFNFAKASPLLYQASGFFGLISITLSYAFIASSGLFNLFRVTALLYQASESSG